MHDWQNTADKKSNTGKKKKSEPQTGVCVEWMYGCPDRINAVKLWIMIKFTMTAGKSA